MQRSSISSEPALVSHESTPICIPTTTWNTMTIYDSCKDKCIGYAQLGGTDRQTLVLAQDSKRALVGWTRTVCISRRGREAQRSPVCPNSQAVPLEFEYETATGTVSCSCSDQVLPLPAVLLFLFRLAPRQLSV